MGEFDISKFKVGDPHIAPTFDMRNFRTGDSPQAIVDGNKEAADARQEQLDSLQDAAQKSQTDQGVAAAEQKPTGAEAMFGLPAGGSDALHTIVSGLMHGTLRALPDLISRATGGGELPPAQSRPLSTPAGQVGMAPLADVSQATSDLGKGFVGHFKSPVVQDVLRNTAGVAGDVSQLAGVAGAERSLIGDAAPAAQVVARTPAQISEAAGFKNLKSQADLRLPEPQASVDAMISKDLNLPAGQVPNAKSVQDARNAGPGMTRNRAQAALPPKMTMDQQLADGINAIGPNTSLLPKVPDIEVLKQTLLGKTDFSPQNLFTTIQEAQEKAGKTLGSQASTASQVEYANALNQAASRYSEFAGRRLDELPPELGAPTSAALAATDKQFAQSYMAENALNGTEHFSAKAYGNAAAHGAPLTDNGAIVANVHNNLPVATPASSPLADLAHAAVGGSVGATVGALTGHSPEIGGLVGSTLTTGVPHIARFVNRMMNKPGADLDAAAGASDNPALSYFKGPDAPKPPAPAVPTPPPALTQDAWHKAWGVPSEPGTGPTAGTDVPEPPLGRAITPQFGPPPEPGTGPTAGTDVPEPPLGKAFKPQFGPPPEPGTGPTAGTDVPEPVPRPKGTPLQFGKVSPTQGALGDQLLKALQATKAKLTGNPVAEDDLPPINTAPWRNPNLPGS
jgi:hypothetical protein